jgi:DNA-binding NarL/FixJ family response regulator
MHYKRKATLSEVEKRELENRLKELDAQVHRLQLRLEDQKERLPENLSKLSKREIEVLLLIGKGMTDKEMARQLFVSVNTVRTHVRRIYDKLLLKNRAEAVNFVNTYKLQ